MSYTYDDQNVFAKILRGEIPSARVLETEHAVAFNDIDPRAPVHVLVVPRGAYVNHDHFVATASEAEIVDFYRAVAAVARQTGAAESAGGGGFRTVANAGPDANHEVPHYHVHVLGGRFLGAVVPRAKPEGQD